jgi:hypothetical protein
LRAISRIDTRWATANAAEIRRHAAELAALAPDVILAHGASTVGPLLQATRIVPIVFPIVGDPVAAGFPCRRQYLLAPTKLSNEWRNVRYWHKATWACALQIRYWG